jgi:hypothetical protein
MFQTKISTEKVWQQTTLKTILSYQNWGFVRGGTDVAKKTLREFCVSRLDDVVHVLLRNPK